LKDNAGQLRWRLKQVGLSDAAISAAWPDWWSDAAEASVSAQAELRFSLARKLGLDPHSLLEDDQLPRFVWNEGARFKHLSGESALEQSAITSFGAGLGRYIVAAAVASRSITGWTSDRLRNTILLRQRFVRLIDLLALCWSFGIPAVHLRIFPCVRKRMAAMAVRVGERSAIMLGRDSMFPAHSAFYLAHELGHIVLGHLSREFAVVDMETDTFSSRAADPEEAAADRFALELLTGIPEPKVLPRSGYSAPELARTAMDASKELRIEPGALALCFGYSTGKWPTANAAMRMIYSTRRAVWTAVNSRALDELSLEVLPDDARSYVMAVLGAPAYDERRNRQ
jgi:hypothetical protein